MLWVVLRGGEPDLVSLRGWGVFVYKDPLQHEKTSRPKYGIAVMRWELSQEES